MKDTVPSWNLVLKTEIGISFGFKLWYEFIYGISGNPKNNHCTQGMHFIG